MRARPRVIPAAHQYLHLRTNPVCAGSGALRCALAAAIGDDLIRRTPVTPGMILESLEAGKRVDNGLTSHV